MALETSVGDTPSSFSDSSLQWSDTPASSPDTSPVSEPTSTDATSTASSPEAATEPPVSPPAEGAKPRDQKGPIPFDRHEAVLAAERQRTADLNTKWQRVAWAEELVQRGATADEVQQAMSMRGDLRRDPIAFFERLLTEAVGRPDLQAQVRSIAGRVLGNGQTPAQTPNGQAPDDEPQPDLQTDNGTLVYSAAQQAKREAWFRKQIDASINQRVAPFEQERQTRIADENHRAFTARFKESAQTELNDLRKSPHWDEAKVTAYMESQNYMYPDGRYIPLKEAWLHVLTTEVLPTLGQTERAKTIADLRTQAAASSVNPKAGASGASATINSFKDQRLKW